MACSSPALFVMGTYDFLHVAYFYRFGNISAGVFWMMLYTNITDI